MKSWIIGMLATASAAGLIACSGSDTGAQGQGAATATATDDVVYVDVRTPQEYNAGHVEGAINIPYDQMADRWQELEEYRDQPMVVYCRTGRRSGIALSVLRQHGFDEATNGGGLSGLAKKGVPTTR